MGVYNGVFKGLNEHIMLIYVLNLYQFITILINLYKDILKIYKNI